VDITLIAISSFILLAIVFLLLFLFKSINNDSFIANDGSIFEKQSDLELYESLYDKTKLIFSPTDQQSSTQPILGFEKSFLTLLTQEGFPDLKTLFIYRKQIKSLSDLINS
tara:strand:- start:120 stop:452 length:333 start_codon:yes stop_codon:yes gene_type:complete